MADDEDFLRRQLEDARHRDGEHSLAKAAAEQRLLEEQRRREWAEHDEAVRRAEDVRQSAARDRAAAEKRARPGRNQTRTPVDTVAAKGAFNKSAAFVALAATFYFTYGGAEENFEKAVIFGCIAAVVAGYYVKALAIAGVAALALYALQQQQQEASRDIEGAPVAHTTPQPAPGTVSETPAEPRYAKQVESVSQSFFSDLAALRTHSLLPVDRDKALRVAVEAVGRRFAIRPDFRMDDAGGQGSDAEAFERAMRETFEARPDADPRDVAREAAHAVIKSLYGHPLAAAYKLRPATPAGLSISASVVEEGYFVVLSEVEALRYGDLIMRIDDAELDGLSAFDAMELAAGEPGTPIKVTVKRPGVDQPVVVHTSRMAIKPTPGGVQTFGEVGYLRLHHSNEVAKDLGSKLAIFETSGITSIILDLRDSTLDVFWPERAAAEHFFPGQDVAKLRYRDAREELLVANKSGAVWSKPVVVLVNARTQGYAEVLAAALRQHRGAELVGCKTYGPGSFIYDRAGTDHGLSFPTAEIIGAHGENLSSGSLKPDVAVAACDPVPEPDAALAEAIRVAKRPAWLRTACRYARIGRLDGLLGC